jgi:predicted site-specific integrase-resolvase
MKPIIIAHRDRTIGLRLLKYSMKNQNEEINPLKDEKETVTLYVLQIREITAG